MLYLFYSSHPEETLFIIFLQTKQFHVYIDHALASAFIVRANAIYEKKVNAMKRHLVAVSKVVSSRFWRFYSTDPIYPTAWRIPF